MIGTDGGLLQHAITIMDGDGIQEAGEQLMFAPADRLQLMFDFTDPHVLAGDKVHLINVGPAFEPFKGLNSDGSLAGGATAATAADSVYEMMEFRVDATLPATTYALTDTTLLNPNIPVLSETGATVRKLGVFEMMDQFNRIMPIIGTAETVFDANGNAVFGALGFDQPVTELVTLGTTEVWEFFNDTADAHPLHVHLGQFQVLGRYASVPVLDQNGVVTGYQLGDPLDTRADLAGVQNLYAEDNGSQDTVWVGPGEALKIIMTFDRPGDYVWHCHILSHEDHDMMRPFKVLGFAGDTTGAISEDSTSPALGLLEVGRADSTKQGFVAGTMAGQYGALTLASNGEWSYAVDARAQALKANEAQFDVITITELDGVTKHDISIAVQGANDAPVVSGPVALANGVQNVTRTITTAELLANARDIDGNALTVAGLTAAAGAGLLLDNGDGTWDFTPNVNSTAPLAFTYQVSDGLVSVADSATLAFTPGAAFLAVTGTALADQLVATAASTYFDLLAGDDQAVGGAGNDVFIGGAGKDQLRGGAGNDRFIAIKLDGNDDYVGGLGIDAYDVSRTDAAATINLQTGRASSLDIGADRLSGIENVVGGSGADIITGDRLANLLSGRNGNDTISAGAGNDTLVGGAGNDLLSGGLGDDTFVFTFKFGADRVTDFTTGTATIHDTLDLSGFGLDFDAIIASTTMDGLDFGLAHGWRRHNAGWGRQGAAASVGLHRLRDQPALIGNVAAQWIDPCGLPL